MSADWPQVPICQLRVAIILCFANYALPTEDGQELAALLSDCPPFWTAPASFWNRTCMFDLQRALTAVIQRRKILTLLAKQKFFPLVIIAMVAGV